MVEARLALEPEVQEIFKYIDLGQNFVLSGGAGSGKTYSLVSVIRQVLAENPSRKVACMTYTNAAVKEIEERVNHKNLHVSTIHDLLWDNIKHFQKELREALVSLVNDPEAKGLSIDDEGAIPYDYYDALEKGIQYKEYCRIREGIISHDELLIVAHYLFRKYPKLNDIVKDKYKFLFIDEYQDTSPWVIKILLECFVESKRQNVIGFFGDAMQSIYDDSIGDLRAYSIGKEPMVNEIKKQQNRRNPQKVINLANKLRTDGIEQVPSEDLLAPNMLNGVIKEGRVLFLYSNNNGVQEAKQYLAEHIGWNFADARQTKELNLTHNLIAEKAGFRQLMNVYDGDKILEYRDRIKKYIKDKGVITDFSSYSFKDVIETLLEGKDGRERKAILLTDAMQSYIATHSDRYEQILSMNFNDLRKIYVEKDQLIDDKKQHAEEESRKGSKRDNLIKHLFKIQRNISLYQSGAFNEFLRTTDYRTRIVRAEDKKRLKKNIESLVNVGNKTIEAVIEEAHQFGICLIDDYLTGFMEKHRYVYEQVKTIPFREFQLLFAYLEGHTPYSTQHKTKGREFDHVLVILDNGNWNHYNFKSLFSDQPAGSANVLSRSQKIFYVCCTRAKEQLAVFFHQPDEAVIAKAKQWFGEENVISIG